MHHKKKYPLRLLMVGVIISRFGLLLLASSLVAETTNTAAALLLLPNCNTNNNYGRLVVSDGQRQRNHDDYQNMMRSQQQLTRLEESCNGVDTTMAAYDEAMKRLQSTAAAAETTVAAATTTTTTTATESQEKQVSLSISNYPAPSAAPIPTNINSNSNGRMSPTTSRSSRSSRSNTKIQNLKSLDEYLNYIDSAPQDTLVVIKYYGNFCPLCKRIAMKYKKMSHFYSSEASIIKFGEIEKSIHKDLFNIMEITTFPYIQIFRNGQCIASHGTESSSQFEGIVNNTIQTFLKMDPQHWQSFLQAFQQPIQKATNNLYTIRNLQHHETTTTRPPQ